MFQKLDHRVGHYLLFAIIWAICSLPNLGGPTLWDIDEGLNAEAAREMLASGNYVVPTFNYKLRSAKPALLYWLQVASYKVFGVNEAAARLPSSLAAFLAILGVYEFGRFAFGLRAALLAGIILATSIGVLGAAHFANPDALLLAFTTWTMCFYFRYWQGRNPVFLYAAAIACGFAVLAKGPVGFLLPAAIIFWFLVWQRDLKRLVDWRLGEAFLLFFLVAAPWYIWVGVETKGAFLRDFWHTHHMNRVTTPMEKHGGSPFYYLVVLILGFLPWSIFLGMTIWNTARQLGRAEETITPAFRFLVVWFGLFFVGFSVVSTKLPNYILPLYPAGVLLTAAMLDRWRTGTLGQPGWTTHAALASLFLTGVISTLVLLVISGTLELEAVRWQFPDMKPWVWIGIFPLLGAVVSWWLWVREKRDAILVTLTVAGLGFVSTIAAGPLEGLNDYKTSRHLARNLPADQLQRDVRLGAYRYDRPSLVFYCQREVKRLDVEEQTLDFLKSPLPSYVFLQDVRWQEIADKVPAGVRVLGRYPDLYGKGQEVLVITNVRTPGEGVAVGGSEP